MLGDRARLEARLAEVERHDEAATQDAVFFRKRMVDAEDRVAELELLRGFARVFLGLHDEFVDTPHPEIAFAMKDAADALRDALTTAERSHGGRKTK